MQQEDTVIYVYPPKNAFKGEPLRRHNPPILKTNFNLLLGAAPGLDYYLDRLPVTATEVPGSKRAGFEMHPQPIYMKLRTILNGADGKDCTWIAIHLFLRWLNSGQGRIITDFEHGRLTLYELLEFSCLVKAEGYERKIERSLPQTQGYKGVDTGDEFDLRDNREDLQEVQTDLGGFTKVPTAMERDE